MKRFLTLLAVILAALLAGGCKGGPKTKLLPNVSGKAGEVVVVIDRDNWEGECGSAIREILGGDCPYLAQREPLFALANVPPGNFNNMFKMHRNLLILHIDPEVRKEGVQYRRNQWAQPQVIAQVDALTPSSALSVIREEGASLAEFFEQAERDRIVANAILYEESSLKDCVEQLTGGVLHFPSGYELKKATDAFLWIADEKQYTIQAVLIYRYPVSGGDLETGKIIERRNAVMREQVPGMFDGTYMTTSAAVAPTSRSLRYHGIDFVETRGFWEVEGDFMGGPFVSHSFYSPDGKDVIVLEAFVYAPKYDKRQYLRQVEALLFSFEWKNIEK